MIRSKCQFLILFLLLEINHFLPQTKIEVKDSSQNKIAVTDTTQILKLNYFNLINNYYDSSFINISPDIPLGFKKLLIKYSLIDNFEIQYKALINKRYFDTDKKGTEYSFLEQQKSNLLNALRKANKPESPELTFIRKYLGLAKDIMTLVLLIIHLNKY